MAFEQIRDLIKRRAQLELTDRAFSAFMEKGGMWLEGELIFPVSEHFSAVMYEVSKSLIEAEGSYASIVLAQEITDLLFVYSTKAELSESDFNDLCTDPDIRFELDEITQQIFLSFLNEDLRRYFGDIVIDNIIAEVMGD